MDQLIFHAIIPFNNRKNMSNGDIRIQFDLDKEECEKAGYLDLLRGEMVTIAILKTGELPEKEEKKQTPHEKTRAKFYAVCKECNVFPADVKFALGIEHITDIDTDSIHEICKDIKDGKYSNA